MVGSKVGLEAPGGRRRVGSLSLQCCLRLAQASKVPNMNDKLGCWLENSRSSREFTCRRSFQAASPTGLRATGQLHVSQPVGTRIVGKLCLRPVQQQSTAGAPLQTLCGKRQQQVQRDLAPGVIVVWMLLGGRRCRIRAAIPPHQPWSSAGPIMASSSPLLVHGGSPFQRLRLPDWRAA